MMNAEVNGFIKFIKFIVNLYESIVVKMLPTLKEWRELSSLYPTNMMALITSKCHDRMASALFRLSKRRWLSAYLILSYLRLPLSISNVFIYTVDLPLCTYTWIPHGLLICTITLLLPFYFTCFTCYWLMSSDQIAYYLSPSIVHTPYLLFS